MPTLTLDDIREGVNRRYEPVTIPFKYRGKERTCVLRQAILLGEKEREKVAGLQDLANIERETPEDVARVVEALKDLIRVVASRTEDADAMLSVLLAGTDDGGAGQLVILMELVRRYGEATQLGEASSSDA